MIIVKIVAGKKFMKKEKVFFESLFEKENYKKFSISSSMTPAGDQVNAIKNLCLGISEGEQNQVLLGVTGSGKTFTIANVIHNLQRSALVLAPNKTLAAQLYGEMKLLFPDNAVEYFVSYYDYYQPEAYVAKTDTFIEKDASINEQIDRMRHSATRSLFERNDVIIVASVSCIYGIGPVETYSKMIVQILEGATINRDDLIKDFVNLQYKRNNDNFNRGTFRVRGDTLEIFPAHLEDLAWRIEFFGDTIEKLYEFDPLTGKNLKKKQKFKIYANSHYVTSKPTLHQAIKQIKKDLKKQLKFLNDSNKLVEYQRLEQRTNFDLEMLVTTGQCSGIENYSRYLTGRKEGEPPPTLFEYLPEDALLFVDESHVTIPQLGGMSKGDLSRKTTLSEHGFRLPSCKDNRPLNFQEWDTMRPESVFISATPGPWELQSTEGVFVEQLIRPTGLIDPVCIVKPAKNQIDDLIEEIRKNVSNGFRTLVTTLTKKMSENLTEYLLEHNISVKYLHSDIDTLERIEIIRDLRLGQFNVLVGINLLREGLDIPECALVAILDADREGFLRSKTSLIQTIGRAARNISGRVILYADKETNSIKEALEETNRRRSKQIAWNKKNNIIPRTISKEVVDLAKNMYSNKSLKNHNVRNDTIPLSGHNLEKHIKELKIKMNIAAEELNFELAAKYRDEISSLEKIELGIINN